MIPSDRTISYRTCSHACVHRWGLHRGPNALELEKHDDGSLGYDVDGTFRRLFGPPITEKRMSSFTVNFQNGIQYGVEQLGVSVHGTRSTGISSNLPNLLLSCNWLGDSDRPLFMHTQWPEGTDGKFTVRVIYPEALSGNGAMIRSNQGRVYVIDSNLPKRAVKGYLAVKKSNMVRRSPYCLVFSSSLGRLSAEVWDDA